MYGICMTIGLLLSSSLALFRAKVANTDVNSLIVIIACIVGCGLVGAKILFLLVSYNVRDLLSSLKHGDGAVFSNSGFVFYGGLIGGLLGAALSSNIAKAKLSTYYTAVVPCIPLGHAFGRIGCFFAGCCYGRATDGPLGICFHAAGIHEKVIPVQLIEAFLNLVLFSFLLFWIHKERDHFVPVLPLYLMSYSIIRFALEFLRGDEIRGFFLFFTTSQWISLFLFFICFMLSWRKHTHP